MPTENKIQSLIHKLEEGGWAKWLKLAVFLTAVGTVFYLALFGGGAATFKGLYYPHAFEQAELARNLARGDGYTTKFLRPAALYQFRENKSALPTGLVPETFHGPAWSTVLAPFLLLNRESWEMDKTQVLYPSDRTVAIISTIFFLLAALVNYFIAKRLFDQRLAIIAVTLLLICDRLWAFSLSGLPHMFMLFFFSCAMYCLLRAVERQEEIRSTALDEDGHTGENELDVPSAHPTDEGLLAPAAPKPLAAKFDRGILGWLLAAAGCFGILALTHALTIWAFLGVVLFCLFYFRPIGLHAGLMILVVLLCYSPWLVRNYRVCGNPLGIGFYANFVYVRGSEPSIMRSMDPPLEGLSPAHFRRKMLGQLDNQLSKLYQHFGSIVAAPFFFIALLHQFRRRSTAVFRWCILVTWLASVFGMSLIGFDQETLNSNDLHILFAPLATFYGLAFILVLWSRWEIRVPLARLAFMAMIFITSGRAFAITFLDLLGQSPRGVHWPPYIPPYIALLGDWTRSDEVIMSDMPWAVAWYADRKSLWVPSTIRNFIELNDWDQLKGQIVGLYLTPLSGDAPFLSQVKKGEWMEWSPFIERTAVLKNFPLKAVTPLPRDQMCVFYADRDRWTLRED